MQRWTTTGEASRFQCRSGIGAGDANVDDDIDTASASDSVSISSRSSETDALLDTLAGNNERHLVDHMHGAIQARALVSPSVAAIVRARGTAARTAARQREAREHNDSDVDTQDIDTHESYSSGGASAKNALHGDANLRLRRAASALNAFQRAGKSQSRAGSGALKMRLAAAAVQASLCLAHDCEDAGSCDDEDDDDDQDDNSEGAIEEQPQHDSAQV